MLHPPSPPPNHSSRSVRFDPSPYLLLIYPIILVLGSLYAIVSPTANPATQAGALIPGVASELNNPTARHPINYFASKRNSLNLYFVKIDWFWTTLAFSLVAYTTHAVGGKDTVSSSTLPRWLQATLRYLVVTTTWIVTTQWLFGPPLIDRSFTLTGGRCEALPAEIDESGQLDVSTLVTSIACKAVGGKWKGGHDISGHVFMLVLSSAFLFLELYVSDVLSPHSRVSPRAAAAVARDTTDEEKREIGGWESDTQAKIRLWTRYFVWTIVGLDLWMLLMTAVWFHTWLEKLSGLLISVSAIWAVYFLPASLPAWRAIVGPV
jgi:Inositol phospholipid synthesis and fat-storage-inducing TM